MEMKLATVPRTTCWPVLAKVLISTAICVALAELVGSATIPLGGNYRVTLLPFLWALLIGAVWGVASPRLPAALQVNTAAQQMASAALQFTCVLGIIL